MNNPIFDMLKKISQYDPSIISAIEEENLAFLYHNYALPTNYANSDITKKEGASLLQKNYACQASLTDCT